MPSIGERSQRRCVKLPEHRPHCTSNASYIHGEHHGSQGTDARPAAIAGRTGHPRSDCADQRRCPVENESRCARSDSGPQGHGRPPADAQALPESSTEVTGERVLADGQKLQHTASAQPGCRSPRQTAGPHGAAPEPSASSSSTVQRRLPFSPRRRSTTRRSTSPGRSATWSPRKLKRSIGVEVPLADLFVWVTPAAPLDKIESAMNAGQQFIGRDLCDHYAFRQGTLDWQIWITADSKPLPRKMVITNRGDEARPQVELRHRLELEADLQGLRFQFSAPPAGATQVQISSAQDQVEERPYEQVIRQAVSDPRWQAQSR